VQIAPELTGAADEMLRAAIARRFSGATEHEQEFRY
jgi:hypothetical protein